jgi:hypothetical protein
MKKGFNGKQPAKVYTRNVILTAQGLTATKREKKTRELTKVG